MVKAFIDDLEVIGNGTVHVSDEKKLKLYLEENMEMEFEFVEDKTTREFKAESKAEKNNLVWVLTNYNNPLGTGVITPIEIGNIRNRKLFASFFVWTPDESLDVRIINYVIYLKKG
jgi:ribosome biogenesis protein Nip4